MIPYTTRAVYFPTLYGVQAIVMGITGRLFDLPIMVIYYSIRFSYLLMYCILVFLSIRAIPFGKWLFGVLVSTPICIIEGAAGLVRSPHFWDDISFYCLDFISNK